MDKDLMIVIPTFKVLVSPEEKKYRAIVVLNRQKLRILLENIPKCRKMKFGEILIHFI
jgi:hypothetical protein